jgi:hypothetical protein
MREPFGRDERSPYGTCKICRALGFLYLAIVGLYRLASGLGYSTGVKVLLFVLMIVPLVSLVTLFYLNSKATPLLRRAGYKVGLLGARR